MADETQEDEEVAPAGEATGDEATGLEGADDVADGEVVEGDVLEGEVLEGEVVADDGEVPGAEVHGSEVHGDEVHGGEVADEVEEVAEQVEVTLDDVLATATSERDEFRDHLLRLQADFDNYRKRVHKELAEAGDRALGSFVEELLPVLDAVDAARAHGAEEVDQVTGLLVDLLAKQGLERVGADGDVFDPTLHDAVLHETGDQDVQTVAQVLRAGWRWRGRVLRPAMVKVVGG